MSVESNAFSRPNFTAADFERAEAENPSDEPMFAPPIYARENTGRSARGGVNPAVWGVAAVVAVALAGGAVVLNQHRSSSGVAELTPGQASGAAAPAGMAIVPSPAVSPPATSPSATSVAATASTPAKAAAPPAAPVRTAQASTRVATHLAPVPRGRSGRAAARSAAGQGVDTSAIAPAAQVAPPAASTAVNPPQPPTAVAPAPTPETAAPAPQPQATETPPTSPPQA